MGDLTLWDASNGTRLVTPGTLRCLGHGPTMAARYRCHSGHRAGVALLMCCCGFSGRFTVYPVGPRDGVRGVCRGFDRTTAPFRQ